MALVSRAVIQNKTMTVWDMLMNGSDESQHIYGVIQNEPYNLKVDARGTKLAYQEPIKITYSRTQRTVRFTSKEFDYSQSGLPQDVEFAIAIGLW